MNKHKLMTILTLLIVTIGIAIYYTSFDEEIYVVNGVFDAHKNLSDLEVIPLDGSWEFYFGHLLEPHQFKVFNNITPSYMDVPSKWTSDAFGKQYPEKGMATYRVVISGLEPGVTYGIKKQNIRVASKIFIDKELVMQDGTPAETNEQEIMGNFPQVIYFESSNNQVEIIIQASNHKYFSGGIAEPIYFGKQLAISRYNEKQIAFEVMTIVLILSMGIIYAVLATLIPSFRKREPASILFPIAVILFALMTSTLSERVIRFVIVDISTEVLLRFEYVVICLSFISLVWFLCLMEKRFVSTGLRNVISAIYALCSVVIILTPMDKFGIWVSFSVINFVVLAGLWLVIAYYYVKGTELTINLKEHSFLLVLLFIVNIYDVDLMAYTLGLKDNMNLAFFVSNLYVLTWLGLMAYRYEEVFRKNEELSISLIESNYNLEKHSNHAIRNEIAFLQAQIKPHFLFNTLSSIISLGKANSPKSLELLIYLSNYLKTTFSANFSSEYIHLQSEIEIINSYIKIEEARFGDRFKFNIEVDPNLLTQKIIPLLIQPLVENAIRHGALKTSQEQGVVNLSIEMDGEFIRVLIADNGPGFDQKLKEMLFKDTSNENMTEQGIGVKNINSRLKHYYKETLCIENNGTGVNVWFKIPLKT